MEGLPASLHNSMFWHLAQPVGANCMKRHRESRIGKSCICYTIWRTQGKFPRCHCDGLGSGDVYPHKSPFPCRLPPWGLYLCDPGMPQNDCFLAEAGLQYAICRLIRLSDYSTGVCVHPWCDVEVFVYLFNHQSHEYILSCSILALTLKDVRLVSISHHSGFQRNSWSFNTYLHRWQNTVQIWNLCWQLIAITGYRKIWLV